MLAFMVVLWILPLFCPSGHLLSPLNRPFERGRSRLGQGLPKSSSSSSSRSPSLLGPFLAAALKQVISSSYLINYTDKKVEICLNIYWIFRYCNTFCSSCFAIKWHLTAIQILFRACNFKVLSKDSLYSYIHVFKVTIYLKTQHIENCQVLTHLIKFLWENAFKIYVMI